MCSTFYFHNLKQRKNISNSNREVFALFAHGVYSAMLVNVNESRTLVLFVTLVSLYFLYVLLCCLLRKCLTHCFLSDCLTVTLMSRALFSVFCLFVTLVSLALFSLFSLFVTLVTRPLFSLCSV